MALVVFQSCVCFCFKQPDLALLDRLLVVHHFVEGLDHHGLGLDRGAVPPERELGVAPEHAQLLVADAPLLDRAHDALRGRLVAETLQGHGQVGLRLPVGQRQPMLAGLAEEVIDRLLGLRGDGRSSRKKLRP